MAKTNRKQKTNDKWQAPILEHREALRARLVVAKGEFEEACLRVESTRAEADEARHAPGRFIRANLGEHNLDPEGEAHLAELHTIAEKAMQTAVAAIEEGEALNLEIGTIERELNEMSVDLQLDGVLAHQAQIKSLEGDVTRIENLIAAQQAVIDRSQTNSTSLGTLPEERELLLADIAAGEAQESALEDIDSQIAAIEKKNTEHRKATADAARDAQPTINGLQVRLEKAKAKRDTAVNRTTDVIVDFILTEAEALGARYRKSAEQACALYVRLLALNQMLADQQSKRRIAYDLGWASLVCPSLRLKAFADAGRSNSKNMLFDLSNELYGPVISNAIEDELERFKSAGVELF